MPPLEPTHCRLYCVEVSGVSLKIPTEQALLDVPHEPVMGLLSEQVDV